MVTVTDFIFLSSKITTDGDCSHKIKRYLLLGRKAMTILDRVLKSKYMSSPTKVHLVKAMVFPVVIYGCESWTKEGWALKNWCLWTVVLEKTLESPLSSKEIKPVNPKGNQPWIFVGRTDCEASKLWSSDAKSHHCKRPDAGKDWGQEEEGVTGWDGWMASSTQWTWVWANSGRQWRTVKPDVLQSMVSQIFGHNWGSEQQ